MKVIIEHYNDIGDLQDRDVMGLMSYIERELKNVAYGSGRFESMEGEISKLQESFARLVDILASKLKFTAEDIINIAGDYIDGEEEQLKLEEEIK